jgi:hypothetical protein
MHDFFSFFIDLKLNKMRQVREPVTCKHRSIINWIFILITMDSLAAVCRLPQVYWLRQLYLQTEDNLVFEFIQVVCLNIYIPITDYCTAASLLFLFGYQYMKSN